MSLIHTSGGSRGAARGPAPSPLFLDQTEAQRAEKNFLETVPPPYIRVWMTPPPSLSEGLDLPLHTLTLSAPHPSSSRTPLLPSFLACSFAPSLPSIIQPTIESFILSIWIYLFLCSFNFTDEEQVVNGHKIKVANAGEPQKVFSQVDSNNVALTVHGPGSASVTSNVKGGSTQTVIFDPRPYDPCPGVKCPKEN